MMYDDSDYSAISAFLAGAFIGAGIALILAPQSGAELRGTLRNYASRAREQVVERGQEAWDTAVERGKEYMESGRQAVQEAGRSAREYMESGKETAREAGKQMSQNRG